MNPLRSIVWLLAALAAVASVHLFLSFKGGVDTKLLPRTRVLESALPVSRIAVSRGGTNAFVVAREEGWKIASPYVADVDERAVMKFLDALRTSEIEETYTLEELLRLGRRRGDFALEPARVSVDVTCGEKTHRICFGDTTPNGAGVYASVEGENAVYVLPASVWTAVDATATDFRRRDLVLVGRESVTAFDVKRGATGSFMSFVRDGESWRLSDAGSHSALSGKAARLLDEILTASAADFVWPRGVPGEEPALTTALLAGYGLDPESSVTLTFKCVDGRDRQVCFGKEAKEGFVYALVQDARAVVTVRDALKDAVPARVDDVTDTRLFPVEATAVSRVSVTDGGVTYLLARGEDGGWLLDAPVSAATDSRTVARLLERLTSLTTADLSEKGVTVSLSTNRPPVTVARRAALGPLRLEDLRSREILRVDPSRLRRLVATDTVGGAFASVVYDRDRRTWNVESSSEKGVVSAEAVEALAASLSPLRAEWIVTLKVSSSDLRNYGLETPRLTLAVDMDRDDDVRRNILVGDEAQGGWFATLGANDAVFVLPSRTVDRFRAKLVSNE